MNYRSVTCAVWAFSEQMAIALRRRVNMKKRPQWPDLPIKELGHRCGWKAGLVERAILSCTVEEIQKQAVDLANYAMMVYDNAGYGCLSRPRV